MRSAGTLAFRFCAGMAAAVGVALASTVTDMVWVADFSSGSVAVTVTVALPAATPVRLSSLPVTGGATVTLVVSDDVAV